MHDWRDLRPVIILGMHRSGTTMVTQFLEQLGLFVGRTKDDNWEARLFQFINDTLMNQCGGGWDNPTPARQLLDNEPLVRIVSEYIDKVLSSPHLASYLGVGGYLRHRSLEHLSSPWGWKDPRNIVFLKVWLRLFPKASLIHVRRHGVDVATSLRARVSAIVNSGDWRRRRHNIPMFLNPVRSRPAFSPRCFHLDGAFSLWEEYQQFGERELQVGGHMQIDYETLLQDPVSQTARIADYCRLDVTRTQVASVCRRVKANRAFAYRRKPELAAFAVEVADRLARFGY